MKWTYRILQESHTVAAWVRTKTWCLSRAAYAPDNEAPKSLQRPPNKPTDLTWPCIGLSSRPTTHKLNLQEWRQISAKMSPLSAVDVQKRHQKETQKLSYPSSLLWLNVYISVVFSLFVVLFLYRFRVFYFLLFACLCTSFHSMDVRCIMRKVT